MIKAQAIEWGVRRWERIWMLAKIEFKLRYYENKLGLFWALLKPASQILVYYIVFNVILSQHIHNYVVYLWSGLLIWQFFLESTTGTVKILQTKRYLYTHTNMNKLEIYLSHTVSNTIGLGFNLLIFLVGALSSKIWPNFYYLYMIPLFFNLCILSVGVGLILSSLFLLFKDISQVWGIFVHFMFYLSPVLYRVKLFDQIPILNYANPISGIINNARNVLLFQTSPDWGLYAFDCGYALILFFIGISLLGRLGPRAGELL